MRLKQYHASNVHQSESEVQNENRETKLRNGSASEKENVTKDLGSADLSEKPQNADKRTILQNPEQSSEPIKSRSSAKKTDLLKSAREENNHQGTKKNFFSEKNSGDKLNPGISIRELEESSSKSQKSSLEKCKTKAMLSDKKHKSHSSSSHKKYDKDKDRGCIQFGQRRHRKEKTRDFTPSCPKQMRSSTEEGKPHSSKKNESSNHNIETNRGKTYHLKEVNEKTLFSSQIPKSIVIGASGNLDGKHFSKEAAAVPNTMNDSFKTVITTSASSHSTTFSPNELPKGGSQLNSLQTSCLDTFDSAKTSQSRGKQRLSEAKDPILNPPISHNLLGSIMSDMSTSLRTNQIGNISIVSTRKDEILE